MKTKVCTKCKIRKNLDKFFNRKASGDGKFCSCMLCIKKYRKDNKENIIKYNKEYRKNNKNYFKELNKMWLENNPDYHENYRNNNKEKRREYNKRYKKDNPEKRREQDRIRRAQEERVNENYTIQDERITKQIFGNKCFKCESTKKIHIDHHKSLSKGNALTVTNAVILCQHCNLSKGIKDPENFYTQKELDNINELFKKAIKLNIMYLLSIHYKKGV